jgi:hypothetical protein
LSDGAEQTNVASAIAVCQAVAVLAFALAMLLPVLADPIER